MECDSRTDARRNRTKLSITGDADLVKYLIIFVSFGVQQWTTYENINRHFKNGKLYFTSVHAFYLVRHLLYLSHMHKCLYRACMCIAVPM